MWSFALGTAGYDQRAEQPTLRLWLRLRLLGQHPWKCGQKSRDRPVIDRQLDVERAEGEVTPGAHPRKGDSIYSTRHRRSPLPASFNPEPIL
jgi:hypothetical protein